jgi:glutamate formiminotransferase
MVPVLEAVPNFSEGRDRALVREFARTIASEGAEVLACTSDADHHRSVISFAGSPRVVERAALSAARLAVDAIDMRRHAGVHPRLGALDVLPFIPVRGLGMEGAAASARRVARGLAEMGIPVYLYGAAGNGKPLSSLRAGGFEALVNGFPAGREPDILPRPWDHPGIHPTAGATCVGARPPLLAWNVYVSGLSRKHITGVARRLRESGGGFGGLRALGLYLPSGDAFQISMNLEDMDNTPPMRVFEAIEIEVGRMGGRIEQTEVIGTIPETLMLSAAASRLKLLDPDLSRLRGSLLAEHMLRRMSTSGQDDPDGSGASGPHHAATGADARRRAVATSSDQEVRP